MEYQRMQMLSWSEFVKISKFAKQIGIKPSAVSNYLKYGTKSMSEEKINELYNLILDYMRENFA